MNLRLLRRATSAPIRFIPNCVEGSGFRIGNNISVIKFNVEEELTSDDAVPITASRIFQLKRLGIILVVERLVLFWPLPIVRKRYTLSLYRTFLCPS